MFVTSPADSPGAPLSVVPEMEVEAAAGPGALNEEFAIGRCRRRAGRPRSSRAPSSCRARARCAGLRGSHRPRGGSCPRADTSAPRSVSGFGRRGVFSRGSRGHAGGQGGQSGAGPAGHTECRGQQRAPGAERHLPAEARRQNGRRPSGLDPLTVPLKQFPLRALQAAQHHDLDGARGSMEDMPDAAGNVGPVEDDLSRSAWSNGSAANLTGWSSFPNR